jgi:predicted transcriptional regulator
MLPCADVHWKLLPAISRELAIAMGKEGMPQVKIASVLGTTTAAVSQYVSGKRGGGKLGAKAREACRKLGKKIARGMVSGSEINSEIARIIVIAKGSRLGDEDPCAICMSGGA